MVLGLRSKSRKRVSTQVHYVIHVQEIKPWPPSQQLRSAQSVLLQWENGDQNSGSFASMSSNGKIEFNKSFGLHVTLWKKASRKGTQGGKFLKNCLVFHLYEHQNEKAVKGQLLGSATIKLADFGIIKETTAMSTQVSCKRRFRNSAQPILYVNIEPFDVESYGSSPKSSLSKELSLDKEERESMSQSINEGNDEDLGIASFTDDDDDNDHDDDDDDSSSTSSQTVGSAYETTGENSKISEGGTSGFDGDFVQPLETSAFTVKEVGASKQLNGIRAHSSDMGNATNDRSSLSELPEEIGRLVDSSYKVPESIQQPNKQIKGVLENVVTSSSYIPVGLQTNLESSSQPQVIQEDGRISKDIGRGQRSSTYGKEKIGSIFKTDILIDDQDEKEKKGKQQEEQINMKHVENEPVHSFPEDDFRRKGKLRIASLPLSRISNEQPKNVLMNKKLDDLATVKLPLDVAESYELFSKSPAQDRAEKINTPKDVHVSAVCHPATDMNDNIPNNRSKLKSEVQMLREELREAAALEVSLYSVVAEHGSSANKVHAPARRLSRFYFHAYRAGMPSTRASAAQSAVLGFVLVSKACGNDVPRLTFWFSNLILLRTIVRKGLEKMPNAYGLWFNNERDGSGLVDRSSPRSSSYLDEEKEIGVKNFCNWEDPQTFLIALEKVEAWIFSRIVESVWWQTLTPHMQPAAAKSSSSRKFYGRRNGVGDEEQGSFSNDLWKRAFKDACERLCPLRAGGHECGCLPVIARLVMEQLVSRLDVAMFNAILRESEEEMPTDPISDPISDSKVLPIPAGKSGFGAGAQLKYAIGNWSRWLSDLFGIDDSDPPEDGNENEDNKSSGSETSFKAFHLLNALSDLMMLPFEMLADSSTRKEVCPRFGVPLIRRVLNNFVPDEFCPGPVPDAVFDALNAEDIQDEEEGCITNVPCTAASIIYSTPPAASVTGILQDAGTQTPKSGSSVLKKSYTSDDELDDLDSPLSAIGIDDPSLTSKFSTGKRGRKVIRYELLREAWRDSE